MQDYPWEREAQFPAAWLLKLSCGTSKVKTMAETIYIKAVASYFFSFFHEHVTFKGKSLQNTYTKHFTLKQTCLNWKWLIFLRVTCSFSCQNHIPHYNHPNASYLYFHERKWFISVQLQFFPCWVFADAKCRILFFLFFCPIQVFSWKEIITEGLLNATTVRVYGW